MGASTNEVEVVDLIKLVFGSAPQHLVEPVRQVKHSAAVAVISPIFGRDDHLGDDMVSQTFKAKLGFYLVEDSVSVGVLLFVTINVLVDVRNGDQGVHGRAALGGKTWVNHAGVLDVD